MGGDGGIVVLELLNEPRQVATGTLPRAAGVFAGGCPLAVAVRIQLQSAAAADDLRLPGRRSRLVRLGGLPVRPINAGPAGDGNQMHIVRRARKRPVAGPLDAGCRHAAGIPGPRRVEPLTDPTAPQ